MKTTLIVIALMALVGLCPAQLIYHTVPKGFDTVDGNYTLPQGTPFGGPNPCRWQWAYRWDSLYHQFPITVFELQLRRSSDATLAGGSYANVVITMASSATSQLSPSNTFANNLDTDATVVYSGPVVIPAYTATGASPAPWLVTIVLSQPFPFDPTRQKDLVIDFQSNGPPSPATGAGFTLDGTFPSPFVSQTGHVSDPNAAGANWANNNAGPIINLGYVAGSPAHFDLSVTTSGSGIGDVTAQFSNIPATTTNGYTLVSMVPASSMGFDYGTGPAFGLFPDALTFTIALLPPSAGDPLHWTWPAAPGVFPATALLRPAGTFSYAAGQTWEACGIALDASFGLVGITPVRQINW